MDGESWLPHGHGDFVWWLAALTDQDQRQNELVNPGLGNEQVKQDLLILWIGRLERLVDGRSGFGQLLVDEFAVDLVLLRQTCG